MNFKTIKEKVISLIKNNKIVLILVALVLLLITYDYINQARYERQKAQNKIVVANLQASLDSIRLVKTKDDKPEYDKLSFVVAKVDELKKLNLELYNEVQNTKGKVLALQKQDFKIKQETIPLIVRASVNDSFLNLSSKYDTVYSKGNYRSLSIEHKYNFKNNQVSGIVTKDEIGFTAKTGIKKTNNGYEIFVQPDYPELKIVGLTGAIIDKSLFEQKKKVPIITLGAAIGYTPLTYDMRLKKINFNPNQIGATIGANINIVEILKRRK